jgi:hypothetical protein
MQSTQAQVIVCHSALSSRDKILSKGLLTYLKLLSSKGIHVWDSASLEPGLNVIEETKQAATFAHIAILLLSIDFFNDPLISEIEPLLLYRVRHDGLHLIPILLRPVPPSIPFESFQYLNSKPIARMVQGEREEVWVKVCSFIYDILDVQPSPNLNSILSDEEVHKLYGIFNKLAHLQVSRFSGSTNSPTNHGLVTEPEKIILSSGAEFERITQTQVLVKIRAGAYTGLVIANR